MPSYTPVTVSSYNATPPADDGTAVEGNRITWSGIKTKLGDPLKTAIESIDDNVAAAITTITTNLSTSTSTLTTVQANIATTIGRLWAPAGTAALFMQTAAPTGWTKGATHNDKALRLVSGAVSTGGSTAFTSVFTSRTITSSNMPSHTHAWSSGTLAVTLSRSSYVNQVSTSGDQNVPNGGNTIIQSTSTDTDTLNATSSISSTASGNAGSGTAMDFAVRYVDVIIATKDA
jgi:hypothetical protein